MLKCQMCGFFDKNPEEFLDNDESVEYKCPKCKSRMVDDDEGKEDYKYTGYAS